MEPGLELQSTNKRVNPMPGWIGLGGLVASICLAEAVPLARTGTTPAKRRFRLTVVGPGGGRPEFWRAALRLLVWVLPGLAGFALWGAFLGDDSNWPFVGIAIQLVAFGMPATMFWSEDHRGIHDRIAGTRVLAER
jgi:uncharacterized RDD family membrane protein YckC